MHNLPHAILVFVLTLAVLGLAHLLHKERKAHAATKDRYERAHQWQQRRDRVDNATNRIFNAFKTFVKEESLPLLVFRQQGYVAVGRRDPAYPDRMSQNPKEIFFECYLRAEPKCFIDIKTDGMAFDYELTDDYVTWVIGAVKLSLKARSLAA